MRGSYPCDLFVADYTDFGLTPRPDQNSYSKPTLRQPPSVPSDPPFKKEASKVHKNAEAEEAGRLLSRYTEAEQTEIAEVFKLLATTRKGGGG